MVANLAAAKRRQVDLTTMPMTAQHREAEFMILLTLKHSKPVMFWEELGIIKFLIFSLKGVLVILNDGPF